MSLISKAHINAARIQEADTQTIGFLRTQAETTYNLVNEDELQQDIMDAFGTQAVSAITSYAIYHTAILLKTAIESGKIAEVMALLQSVNPALAALDVIVNSPAPNLSVFQPQADGTVQYVAPIPEEQPEL